MRKRHGTTRKLFKIMGPTRYKGFVHPQCLGMNLQDRCAFITRFNGLIAPTFSVIAGLNKDRLM